MEQIISVVTRIGFGLGRYPFKFSASTSILTDISWFYLLLTLYYIKIGHGRFLPRPLQFSVILLN